MKENNYFVVRVSFVGILGSIKISTELIRRVLSALLYWFHILQIFSRRCEGQATLLVTLACEGQGQCHGSSSPVAR